MNNLIKFQKVSVKIKIYTLLVKINMNYSAIIKFLKINNSLNKNILNLKINKIQMRNKKINLAIMKKEMYLINNSSVVDKKQYPLSKRSLTSLAR